LIGVRLLQGPTLILRRIGLIERGAGGSVIIGRAAVRARFEARFTASRMAQDYLAAYERLLVGPRFGQAFAGEMAVV
jgi:hypothetical protein